MVMRILYLLVFVILAVLLALGNTSSARAAPTGTTRYVDATTGSDTGNNCATLATPCASIQRAVNQSATDDEIRVAAGTYLYNPAEDIPCSYLFTRAIVCVQDKRLWIRGGFTTNNWNSYNPTNNITRIDGQSTRRGVYVYWYQSSTSLIIEGFTIQNCSVTGPSYGGVDPTGYGGGMWAIYADVTLRDINFTNNIVRGQANPGSGIGGTGAGAGLAVNSGPEFRISTAVLQRVTFSGNQSFGATGSIRGGIAFGALHVNGSTANVQDSTFTNNTATGGNSSGCGRDGCNPNGANEAYALGAAIGAEQASLTLTRLSVTGNNGTGGNAATYGGGAHGGGIFSEDGTFFSLTDSTVMNNALTAGNSTGGGAGSTGGYAFGGGVSLLRTPGTIERTKIIANTARGGNTTSGGSNGAPGGGGVYLNANGSGTATLTNVIIADNSGLPGSGGTSPGGGGGGIQIQGVNATLNHVTFARNSLGTGLVLGQGILLLTSGSANVNYNIIANHIVPSNGVAVYVICGGTSLAFNGGLFAGNNPGKDADSNCSPDPISGLPIDSASSAGFASPGSPNYDYHLAPGSAAINRAIGSQTTNDIDGNNRPHPYPSGTRDNGADEYTGPPPVLTPRSFLPIVIR